MQNLIVFAKKPILGRVKTRLAEALGDAEALRVYKEMLWITKSLALKWTEGVVTRQVHWFWDEKEVTEETNPTSSLHLPPLFRESYQIPNADLGKRMAHAFDEVFSWQKKERLSLEWEQEEEGNSTAFGGQGIVIIGSDCPNLSLEILEQAFHGLIESDVTIGPAEDGGYYLLGMKCRYLELFQNVEWSTDSVFSKTLANSKSLGLRVKVLPVLRDIDTVEDLRKGEFLNKGFVAREL